MKADGIFPRYLLSFENEGYTAVTRRVPLNHRFDAMTLVKGWGRDRRAERPAGPLQTSLTPPPRHDPPWVVLSGTQAAGERREGGRAGKGWEQRTVHSGAESH